MTTTKTAADIQAEIEHRISELEWEARALTDIAAALRTTLGSDAPAAPHGYLADGVTPRKRRPNRSKVQAKTRPVAKRASP